MKNWQALAQTVLQELWGKEVTCITTDEFRNEGRNRVYRLALTNAPVSSAILKASVGDEQNPYTIGDTNPRSAFSRFCNEWAGCQMLAPLGLGAKAYVGSVEHGFFIMEDLGEGISLADKLTSNKPAEATDALFLYARSLGQLHAATQNQVAHWQELRNQLGATNQSSNLETWANETQQFTSICQRLSINIPEPFNLEMKTIQTALEHPNDYLVFTPTDCCPDNHYLQNESLIFFDCEWATMRHALLDVAYMLVPFPTCWCMSAIPKDLTQQLIETYRKEFNGSPDFEDQLTLAMAYWTINTLTWKWAGDWEETDHTWGLVTLRQRHLHRLENLLARENLFTLLPSFNQVARDLHSALQMQWKDLIRIPLYPAFSKTD